jgi:hypothetical protein
MGAQLEGHLTTGWNMEPKKSCTVLRECHNAVSGLGDQISAVHPNSNPWLYIVVTELDITCLNTQFRNKKKKKY